MWWYSLGVLLTGLGYLLFSSFIHAGGIGFWLGSMLLPGLWLSALFKPILPTFILDSRGYLWLYIIMVQIVFWHALGIVVLLLRRRYTTPGSGLETYEQQNGSG